LGKIGDTGPFFFYFKVDSYIFSKALADTVPLGVNTNVTFDEVGGLDDRELLIFV
jgi:hypothetical protein